MSDKNLDGFTVDFNTWKEHYITKMFLSLLGKEANKQLNNLSSIYLNSFSPNPSHPGNKLIAIGAFSHAAQLLKIFKNITAKELFENKGE